MPRPLCRGFLFPLRTGVRMGGWRNVGRTPGRRRRRPPGDRPTFGQRFPAELIDVMYTEAGTCWHPLTGRGSRHTISAVPAVLCHLDHPSHPVWTAWTPDPLVRPGSRPFSMDRIEIDYNVTDVIFKYKQHF